MHRYHVALFLLPIAALPAQGWTLRTTATKPMPAVGAAMAYDSAHDRLVLFGGKQRPSGWPNPHFNDTWLFDGNDWALAAPTQQPSPRAHHSMAATALRWTAGSRRVFLFGGIDANGSPLNDLWTWDGNDWTFHPNSNSPPPRYMAAMTSYGRGVLLFGGRVGQPTTYLDDTWSWSSGQWSGGTGAGPSGRHSAVLSEGRRLEVVMHGGRDATRSWIDETWTWDNGWQQQPTATGPARVGHALVYDWTIDRHFLVAGESNGVLQSDIWRLERSGWRDITPAGAAPGPVAYPAAAFDSLRHRVYLFGGEQSNGVSDELWEFGSTFPVATVGTPCALRGAPPQLTTGAALLGSNWSVTVSSASFVPFAVLSIGFDEQSWNGVPLPASLASVGLPNCLLRVAPIQNQLLTGGNNTSGIGTFAAIPDAPELIGFDVVAQAGIVDAIGPSAVTAAVRATIY